jgi:hypothetical protein
MPHPAFTDDELDAELAKLHRPRKYYQNYQRTRGANDGMLHAPQAPARLLPRLLLLQERRLQREQSPSPKSAYRRGDGANSNLLLDGERQGHGGDRCAVHAASGLHRKLQWLAEAEVGVYATEYGRTGFTARYRVIACGGDPILEVSLRCKPFRAEP